ncbi:MAG TPA: F0F1 ATP synthase subunit B [Bacteroidota bacterium]|nr:F0F1 ATP synthase subunit B [Bacteroidota bacterium]
MLEINPGLIIWTIITFVLVLLVLRGTAWKPIVQALKDREDKIRSSLEEAEKARTEAQHLLDENRQVLLEAEAQSAKIIHEGRDMGERMKSEILEKAQTASRQMVDQAKDEIRREKDAALVQLRTEVSDLAIAAAGKILDANLDNAQQRRLVDKAIQELSGKS